MGQGLEESGLMRDMRCQGILGGDKPAGGQVHWHIEVREE